jgi:hypothetical protein
MILLMISATNFTELSKILCIFVQISEQILQFILDFFAFGEKIEELNPRALPSQHPLFQKINWGLGEAPTPTFPALFCHRQKRAD